jgi:hypothetical protein
MRITVGMESRKLIDFRLVRLEAVKELRISGGRQLRLGGNIKRRRWEGGGRGHNAGEGDIGLGLTKGGSSTLNRVGS